MEVMQITQEDIDERDEYCSRARLKELMKKSTYEDIIKDDIIMYFAHELGMIPLAWQFKVLKAYNEGARKIVCCTSRQIGKTIMAAGIENYRVDYNRGYFDRPIYTNRHKYTAEVVISRGDEQAKEFLRQIKLMRYAGDEYVATSYLDKKGKPVFGKNRVSGKHSKKRDGNNLSTITLKSGMFESKAGSFIQSQPPTDVILGKTYTGGILDEASRIEDNIITENFLPTLKSFGRFLMVISTPLNPDGYFYNRVDPDERGTSDDFVRFMFDIDAIKIELPDQWEAVMKEVEQLKKDGKENEVLRNYYCSFLSSDELYFPPDKIKEIFKDEIEQVTHYRQEPVSIGIDFGGLSASHTVITVSTVPDSRNISKRIACWRYPIKQDADIIGDIKFNILPNFNVKYIVVDMCPASNITVQNMKKEGWNITEFAFTRTSKPDYMDRFRKRLSRGWSITYNDEAIKQEFANFTDILKPKKGHTDDLIDSWMLSCVPFMDDTVNFAITTIGGDDEDDEETYALKVLEEHTGSYETESYLGESIAI